MPVQTKVGEPFELTTTLDKPNAPPKVQKSKRAAEAAGKQAHQAAIIYADPDVIDAQARAFFMKVVVAVSIVFALSLTALSVITGNYFLLAGVAPVLTALLYAAGRYYFGRPHNPRRRRSL